MIPTTLLLKNKYLYIQLFPPTAHPSRSSPALQRLLFPTRSVYNSSSNVLVTANCNITVVVPTTSATCTPSKCTYPTTKQAIRQFSTRPYTSSSSSSKSFLTYRNLMNHSSSDNDNLTTNINTTTTITKRYIQNESDYLRIVSQTLQTIHDTIDNVLDQQEFITDYEITLAQNVLTLSFPPHGTWVINQQTPNLQIWWSSPLSGPKRFEYDDTDQLWFSTKDGLNLGHALSQEIQHIYPDLDPIELNV